jgi:hypothetical protein
MPIDLDPIVSSSTLDLEFRELPLKILEIDDNLNLGLELFSPSNKIFSVDSATATITGTTSAINCTISGDSIVYCPISINTLGWNYIDVDVNVGSQKFVYQLKKYVD